MPIDVPAGVTVTIDGQAVNVKGPKGELSLTVATPIEVSLEEGQVLVTRPDDERASRSPSHEAPRRRTSRDLGASQSSRGS